eukprot:g34560.t1
MIIQEQAKHYRAVLTSPILCIRHKVRDGLNPAAASILQFHFEETLQYISFDRPMQRMLPFSDFTAACLGFYSTGGEEAQTLLNVTARQAEVDPAKALTLFFTNIRPIYLELQSRSLALEYLRALLWLKLFLSPTRCYRVFSDQPQTGKQLKQLSTTSPPFPAPFLKGTPPQERLLLFRDRRTLPKFVHIRRTPPKFVVARRSSESLYISPVGEPRKTAIFPLSALTAIHTGRRSDIFGVTKWVVSLRFQGKKKRSLHFALPTHGGLKTFIDSIAWLTNVAPSDDSCIPIAMAVVDDPDSGLAPAVNIHLPSPGPGQIGPTGQMGTGVRLRPRPERPRHTAHSSRCASPSLTSPSSLFGPGLELDQMLARATPGAMRVVSRMDTEMLDPDQNKPDLKLSVPANAGVTLYRHAGESGVQSPGPSSTPTASPESTPTASPESRWSTLSKFLSRKKKSGTSKSTRTTTTTTSLRGSSRRPR